MQHDRKLAWLDLIRGCSAILVCASHLRGALFVPYGQLQSPTLIETAFYFLTSLGPQAVMAFFVLSGFFVGGSVIRSGAAFDVRKYSLDRLTRLWVVLIPALVFTRLTDAVLAAVSPGALEGACFGQWSSGPAPDRPAAEGALAFAGNVFFLQTLLVPIFGTNGPLWSLANEFWYYLLFPLLMFGTGVCGRGGRWPRLGAMALAGVLLLWLPPGFASGFLVWLLGTLVWLAYARNLLPVSVLALGVGAMLLAGALTASAGYLSGGGDLIDTRLAVGASFALFAAALVKLRFPAGGKRLLLRFAQGTSEISYTLYLVHYPAMLLLVATLTGGVKLEPTPAGCLLYIGCLSLLVACAFLMWWTFERRTQDLKRVLLKYSGSGARHKSRLDP